ncbi:hypothetical protein COBT_003035 [Conglomerata obtusa]
MLKIVNTDVLLKINTVDNYIDLIWTRIFNYKEIQNEAYLYIKELRKNDLTVTTEYKLIEKDVCYQIDFFEKKISKFHVDLMISFESIKNFYADLFTTNHLHIDISAKYILHFKLLLSIENFINKIFEQQKLYKGSFEFLDVIILNWSKHISIYTKGVSNDKLTFTTHKIGMLIYNQLIELQPDNLQTPSNSILLAFSNSMADINFHEKYKNAILVLQNRLSNTNENVEEFWCDQFYHMLKYQKRFDLYKDHNQIIIENNDNKFIAKNQIITENNENLLVEKNQIITAKNDDILVAKNQSIVIASCGIFILAVIYSIILLN